MNAWDWVENYVLVSVGGGSFLCDHISQEEFIESYWDLYERENSVIAIQGVTQLTTEAFELLQPAYRAKNTLFE